MNHFLPPNICISGKLELGEESGPAPRHSIKCLNLCAKRLPQIFCFASKNARYLGHHSVSHYSTETAGEEFVCLWFCLQQSSVVLFIGKLQSHGSLQHLLCCFPAPVSLAPVLHLLDIILLPQPIAGGLFSACWPLVGHPTVSS